MRLAVHLNEEFISSDDFYAGSWAAKSFQLPHRKVFNLAAKDAADLLVRQSMSEGRRRLLGNH